MKRSVTTAVFVAAVTLSAQDTEGKTVPLGTVSGSNGMVYKPSRQRFVIKHMHVSKKSAYSGDEKVVDGKNRSMKMDVTKFVYRRGIVPGLDMRVVIPRVKKENSVMHPVSKRVYDNSNEGLGDVVSFVRYALSDQRKGDPVNLCVGAGVKLPTGDTQRVFATPQGSAKTPTMQLGSGSTDYLAEIGMTKILPHSRIDAHVTYKKTNVGDNAYEFGNKVTWNIGYNYALNPRIDIGLGLHGHHTDKHRSRGVEVAYTGGTFAYLSPEVHFRPNRKFDLSAGYAKMIHRDNNYDISSNTGGLSEDHRVMFHLGYNF